MEKNKSPRPNPVRAAVALLGGLAPTARHFRITPQAVFKWTVRGVVPPTRCIELERLTEGRISRRDLNPSVFAD